MNHLARIGSALLLLALCSTPASAGANPHEGATIDSTPITGKVIETMDSGGYTYLQVESEDGQKTWAACDQTVLKIGDVVTIPPGMGMQKFRSPTLGREFENIRFVGSLKGAGAAMGDDDDDYEDEDEDFEEYHEGELPPGHPPTGAGLPKGHPPVGATAADAVAEPIDPPAGGIKISDVYARKAELAGKEVSVRGKVVRYTANVMGKNWLHIQDGSGSPTGNGDLTITTDAQVNRGNIVTAKGKLSVDQDFGYGYTYDVLLEDADVTAE